MMDRGSCDVLCPFATYSSVCYLVIVIRNNLAYCSMLGMIVRDSLFAYGCGFFIMFFNLIF